MSLQSQLNSSHLPSETELVKAVAAFMVQRDALTSLLQSNLPNIASKLYTKSVISQDALLEAMNQTQIASVRTVSLLSVVEAKIKAEPSVFTEFVKILESEPSLKSQANDLVKNYLHGSCNSSSIPSATSFAISRYGDYLEGVYSTSFISNDGKFPPTPSKKYVNLAVVKHRDAKPPRDIEELRKHTLHGRVDELLKDKEKIGISDILKPREGGNQIRLVFVEGPPGMGKSTLAWELCRRWDRKQYDLAVLLRLRERRVQQITKIADLFLQFDTELQQSVAKDVLSKHGKGVLFILDGYDELPAKLRHEGLLFELLKGEAFPKCTVLVTSRPSATNDLYMTCRPQIQRHVEILGFTQESVETYASSIFSSEPELKEFLLYISASANPAINSLMYIPLNAAIVVEIYRSNRRKGGPIPKTMTQLYTQLCLILLQRYLNSIDPQNTTKIAKFDDLPDTYKTHFNKLAQLAFEMFEKHKVIFYSDSDFEFRESGFLDRVPALYCGDEDSYNFLHLTLQEFLAAYHITQHPNGTYFFRCYCEDKRWNIVWRFVSGLTKFDYFKDSVQSDAFTNMTIKGLGINNLLLQCLFEGRIKFDYMKAFWKNTVTVYMEDSSPLDRYAAGYCIANSSATTSWKVTMIYGSAESFMWGLNSNHCDTHGVISYLVMSFVSPQCLDSYPTSMLHGIKQLNLEFRIEDATTHLLVETIPLMKNLSTLYLASLSSDAQEIALQLVNTISHSNITTLTLHWKVYPHPPKPLCDVLFGPSSLNHLTLTLPNFTEDSFDLLVTNTCLTEVRIWTEPSNGHIQALSKILLNNRTIQILKWGIVIEEEDLNSEQVDNFNTALSSNTTFKKLTLDLKPKNPHVKFSPFASDSRLRVVY